MTGVKVRWGALAALFLMFMMLLALPGGARAAAGWNAGTLQESTITDCVSIINGNPYNDAGAGATSYVYEDYNNPVPAGTAYDLAVTVYGIGDACSGQAADIHLKLPANTTIDDSPSLPITCYPLEPSGNNVVDGPSDTSGACPQSPAYNPGDGTYTLDMSRNSGFDSTSFYPFWAIPTGYGVEIHIPVVTSSQETGQAEAIVNMADGNSNPTLTSPVNVIVGPKPVTTPSAGPTSVTGPQVTNITDTGAQLGATFVYNYSTVATPTFLWDRKTPEANELSFSIDPATPQYEVSFGMSVTGLQPGCTYDWKAEMQGNMGGNVLSSTPDMTFMTTGSGGNCATPVSGGGGSGGSARFYARPSVTTSSQAPTTLKPPPPEPPITKTTTTTSSSSTTSSSHITITTTKTSTSSTTTTTKPPVIHAPTLPGHPNFSGLTHHHAGVSLRLSGIGLSTVTISLPHGLTFGKLRHGKLSGLTVRGVRGRITLSLSHGRLTIHFGTAASSLTISDSSLSVSSSLARQARRHKVHHLTLGLTITGANHHAWRLTPALAAG